MKKSILLINVCVVFYLLCSNLGYSDSAPDELRFKNLFKSEGQWNMLENLAYSFSINPKEAPKDPNGYPVGVIDMDLSLDKLPVRLKPNHIQNSILLYLKTKCCRELPKGIKQFSIPMATNSQPHTIYAVLENDNGRSYEIPFNKNLAFTGWKYLILEIPNWLTGETLKFRGLRIVFDKKHHKGHFKLYMGGIYFPK